MPSCGGGSRGCKPPADVRAQPAPQRLGLTSHAWLEQARDHVRQRLLAHAGPSRATGVVTALITGDQAAIAKADWQVFRTTGVAHLVSISGLHITMFAWLAVAVVGWMWRRSARLCLHWPAALAAAWAGLALALAYALFSGWGIPAQRTLLMLLTVTVLRSLGMAWPWPRTWLLVLAVVVAWDPWALLQAGFWLKFCRRGHFVHDRSGAACCASAWAVVAAPVAAAARASADWPGPGPLDGAAVWAHLHRGLYRQPVGHSLGDHCAHPAGHAGGAVAPPSGLRPLPAPRPCSPAWAGWRNGRGPWPPLRSPRWAWDCWACWAAPGC